MIEAKIKNIKLDSNKNILVETEYKRNGELIQVGRTRYAITVKRSLEDIKKLIDKDIKQHSEYLIAKIFTQQKNIQNITNLLSEKVGKKYNTNTTNLKISEKIFTINEDSIISVKNNPDSVNPVT